MKVEIKTWQDKRINAINRKIKNGVAKVRVEILEDESRKYVSTDQKNNYVAEAAEVTEISKKNLLSSSERKEKVVEKKTEENLENSILTNKELLIQVGAFTDHRNAKTLSEKLSEFKAFINRVFINNKYLYRVRIGPISREYIQKSWKLCSHTPV